MKLTIAVGALALAACGPAAAPAPEPLSCTPIVPVTAQHPITTRPAALAGTYDLIRVHSQPNNGFWGWWTADRGGGVESDPSTGRVNPDPAGYFCALRRGPSR